MSNFIDLTGQVFGQLTVISYIGKNKRYQSLWLCDKIMLGTNLLRRNTKSCGCLQKAFARGRRFLGLEAKVYGKLTVIDQAPVDHRGRTRWNCICECGNTLIVYGTNLRNGHTRSCGCAHRDVKRGNKSHKWCGGRSVDAGGYVRIYAPDHPNADTKGYIKEHTYVMSQIIGRSLLKGETVHHKDGIKGNNEPYNLELWAHNHSDGQRVSDLIPYWKKMLELYAPELLK
jgi:hypothetical protein